MTDIAEVSMKMPASGHEGEDDDVYCTVLLFKTGGQPFVAITKLGHGDLPTAPSKILGDSQKLGDTVAEAERDGLLFPVSNQAFDDGPVAALGEALTAEPDKATSQRAARAL